MKIDPNYQRQTCRPMSLVSGGISLLVSGGIKLIRIFAKVPRKGSVKRQWGCRERQISAFSLAIFRILEIRPALLYGDMQSVVGFSVIPKCMTLNDLDWLFCVKLCLRAGLAGWHRATLENNCVKSNKDRHILSAVQIFGMDSGFCQYKVCANIRSGSLERRR